MKSFCENYIPKFVLPCFFISLLLFVGSISLIVFYPVSSSKFSENNQVDYKVYLNNNDYYENDYVTEQNQYISSLIQYVLVDYNYFAHFDSKKDLHYEYDVVARVKIFHDEEENVIYQKDDPLVKKVSKDQNAKSVDVLESIKVDYQKYNKIVKNFRSKYNLSVDSKLDVIMTIHVFSKDGEFIRDYSNVVSMDLSKQLISIQKKYVVPEINGVLIHHNNKFIPLPIIYIISFICGAIFLFFVILIIIRFIRCYYDAHTPYSITVNKILRDYDDLIANVKETPTKEGGQVINVTEFLELVDIANNLNRPILYTPIVKGSSCLFSVIGDNEIYKYYLNSYEVNKKRKK